MGSRPSDVTLDCAAIPFTVESGHTAKVEFGYAIIPKVGLGLSTTLGDKNLRRSILFDDLPIRIPLGFRTDDAQKAKWVVVPAASAIDIAFEGNSIAMTRAGSVASANPQITAASTDKPDPSVQSARDALSKALVDLDDARPQPTCSLKKTFAVLVDDVQFGPNNAIAKFMVDNWNDMTKGPGPHNELVAAVNRLGIQTKNTNQVSGEVYDKLNKNVSDAFGANSAVAVAARAIGRTIDNTVVRPNLPVPAIIPKLIQPPIPNPKKPCTWILPFGGCGGGGGGGGGGGNGGVINDGIHGHQPPK